MEAKKLKVLSFFPFPHITCSKLIEDFLQMWELSHAVGRLENARVPVDVTCMGSPSPCRWPGGQKTKPPRAHHHVQTGNSCMSDSVSTCTLCGSPDPHGWKDHMTSSGLKLREEAGCQVVTSLVPWLAIEDFVFTPAISCRAREQAVGRCVCVTCENYRQLRKP